MNQETIKKEAEKWRDQDIITEQQLNQILSLYPKRDRGFLLVAFAGLFIGLGFLTFIASNWSYIPEMGKMAIILVFMVGFYVAGEITYRNKSKPVGLSFFIIGLLVFGAGIFLTGQMYNFMYFEATPFFIWSVAGIALFIIYPHVSLYVVSIVITTVGQLYSGFVYDEFHVWIFVIFLLAFAHYTYHQSRTLYGYLFSISFLIQTTVLLFSGRYDYYWIFIPAILLYLVASIVKKQGIMQPFRIISTIVMFGLAIFHVFFLGESYFTSSYDFEFIFLVVWFILFVSSAFISLRKKDLTELVGLVLFFPVLYLPFGGDLLAMLQLFVFSIGLLLVGYQQEQYRNITLGTFSFLISTMIAYIHLAWAFLNKSLFFFFGGIILFILSYFLERKRREVKKEVKGGQQ